MRWENTIAYDCRYGDVLGRILKDANIIWEDSEADWQGHVNIVAAMPDGTFIHYEYDYGSCPGCDTWEAAGLSDDEIEVAMRKDMAVFRCPDAIIAYLDRMPKTAAENYYYPSTGEALAPLLEYLAEDSDGFN